jgi:hypothetical protein
MQRRYRGSREQHGIDKRDFQVVFPYTPANIANLESSHSPKRLAPYYALAGGDKELGLKLYAWNSALSQALYTPLQALEVTLRNGIGSRLQATYGAQ